MISRVGAWFAFILFGSCSVAFAAPQIGDTAPALVVRQLDGSEFNLASRRGTVVVINVWATWCPPCRAEMPALDAFYRHHRDEGVEVIGLSADDLHDRKDVVKVMHDFSYPAALAAEATANGFGVAKVLPITYIVGADGIIGAILKPGHSTITEETLVSAAVPLLPTAGRSAPQ